MKQRSAVSYTLFAEYAPKELRGKLLIIEQVFVCVCVCFYFMHVKSDRNSVKYILFSLTHTPY